MRQVGNLHVVYSKLMAYMAHRFATPYRAIQCLPFRKSNRQNYQETSQLDGPRIKERQFSKIKNHIQSGVCNVQYSTFRCIPVHRYIYVRTSLSAVRIAGAARTAPNSAKLLLVCIWMVAKRIIGWKSSLVRRLK